MESWIGSHLEESSFLTCSWWTVISMLLSGDISTVQLGSITVVELPFIMMAGPDLLKFGGSF